MFASLICYLERQRVDGGAVDTSGTGPAINEESPHSSSIHFPLSSWKHNFADPECRRRTHPGDFLDIPCVITHRQRCTPSIRPASARPPPSLLLESPSPSTLCWPRRRTRAAAGAALLSAQTDTTQQRHLRRWPRTPAYPSQQRRTSAHRACCTQPVTCHPDTRSTAALPSATSRHAEAHFTHKVQQHWSCVTGR